MSNSVGTWWPHLGSPGLIRERASTLASAHRKMMFDLFEIRVERGMTREDVAEVLGITPQRVSKLERYDSNPRLEAVRKYANAIGALLEIRVIDSEAPTSVNNDPKESIHE